MDVVEKLLIEHPEWTVEDWELFWCKKARSEKNWADLKVCDKCNCERQHG